MIHCAEFGGRPVSVHCLRQCITKLLAVMMMTTDAYANIAASEERIISAVLMFGIVSKAAALTDITAVILRQINHGVTSTKGLK